MNRSNCWFTYFLIWLFLSMMEANKNMDKLVGIFNGKTVTEGSGKWPFMVAIFRKNETGPHKFHCGGTIVHDRAILTAAHCLIPRGVALEPKDVILLIGNENIIKFNDNRNEIALAQKFEVHSEYARGGVHDIAIIKLRWSIPLPKRVDKVITVDKVCLPPTDDEWLYDKTNCIAMGWGKTEKGFNSFILKEVTLPVVSDTLCSRYRLVGLKYLPEIMFCAGYKNGGKDACSGDSGGPFLCPLRSKPAEYVQIGIVSNGYRCGEPWCFGYYTKVTHYLDWIKNAATFKHDEL